ncbi:MAG: diol dehydratase reactivase subunit alpha, partial [Actinomycetota bacterium]|nr:diol dehydratase reactivase subunit alpha [Actinomycetota bacterium]
MLVAGVDVGNSTTEVAVARVQPGHEPSWLFVGRCPTTGPKGSADCVHGIAELLARAERRLGARAELGLLAELHPVRTDLLELGRIEELALERTAIARPASQTPSGSGVGSGWLTRLDDLAGPPAAGEMIVVVSGVDFDAAARRLREARERGWQIAAAIVDGDDGVLIGNRFDRSMPIVDEVSDAAQLPIGALAAVEVAEAGGSTAILSDPLRLGLLLGFDPDEARSVRTAARAVAGCRAAIVVRTPRTAGSARSQPSGDGAVLLVGADGAEQ